MYEYCVAVVFHALASAALVKCLASVSPSCVTTYYSDFVLCVQYVLVARFTFFLSKRIFLRGKVEIKNKAVIITGCDSGFGNMLARRLDGLGLQVFAGCLSPSGPGARALREACSPRTHVLGMDVTRPESVSRAARYVTENLGVNDLWAVVNNAGVLKGFSTELTQMEDYESCLAVNALGPVRVTKSFLPLLRKSRGRVVNVVSLAGRMASPLSSPYSMSKFAAAVFTDCLRLEMSAWGVRVIAVEPEMFLTEIVNPKTVCENFDKNTDSLDQRTRSDYGDKYFSDCKKFIVAQLGRGSTKIHKVVESLEAAILQKYPDAIYTPSRNIGAEISIYLLKQMPHTIHDAMMKLYLLATRFPKVQRKNH